jgi:hypothetical protein
VLAVNDPQTEEKCCTLHAFAPGSGAELWKVDLPGEPVMDGLCIARDGSVIVQLLDGGVVCYEGRQSAR